MSKSGVGDGTITAIVVENASGRQAITGKIFIEGSGTAQLAAAAGVPFLRGGGPQPKTADWDGVQRPIPGGLLWIMSGIDFRKTAAHQKSANDPRLSKLIAEADAAKDIPKGLYRPRMKGDNVYGDLYIGHPTLDMSPMLADGTFIMWQNVPYEWALRMDENADDDARAKRELRGFIDAEARFLKKYVPGFENSVLMDVGRFVGVRDGRHPVGEYVFSIDDARHKRTFRDAVTQADDQNVLLGQSRKIFVRSAVPLLPAKESEKPHTYGRLVVVYLRYDFHGHAELSMVHADWRNCGFCGRAMHRQKYFAERAGVDDTVFLIAG